MKNFNLTTIHGKNLILDVSELVRNETVYLNATKLALQFGKNKQRLNEFFNSKSFLEYEKAVFKVTKNRDFKTEEKGLKFSIKGKYGGTYLHSDLVIVFLRWLDVEFAVMCDMYIKEQIQQAHAQKIEAHAIAKANQANEEWLKARAEAIATRNELTDATKAFCEYAQQQRGEAYKKGKCPYYIKLTALVYKALNIKKPKGTKTPRDIYSGAVVEKIEYLEVMLINLLYSHIQQGTEYHEAYKNIKELVEYEALLLDEVA